ncbi:MAG: hypothetical protein WC819_04470 [Parcubacteria group bacterium]|jgi:UDPglucose 6-dehydrogenase
MKRVAVLGSGVVGRATGLGFLSKGHDVIFYDVQDVILKKLVTQGYDAKHIDFLDTNESDIFFFVISTPTENEKINLTYMMSAAKTLGKKLRDRKDYFVIVVRSTVLPGTTENIIVPIIEKASNKKAGRDFGVSMNPEYLREVNAEKDFKKPWVITIGTLDKKTKKIMGEVYKDFDCPIYYVSIKEAEMQKYVHNLYNATKIAFFNEMRLVSHCIGVQPDKIFEITADSAEAFWNKKYGLRNRGPFDGMCLPKDTQAFFSWSKKLKIKMNLLKGVIASNNIFESFWHKTK